MKITTFKDKFRGVEKARKDRDPKRRTPITKAECVARFTACESFQDVCGCAMDLVATQIIDEETAPGEDNTWQVHHLIPRCLGGTSSMGRSRCVASRVCMCHYVVCRCGVCQGSTDLSHI